MNYKGKYIISTQVKDGVDFYFTNILLSKKLKTASTTVFKSDREQICTFRVHSKLTNDDGTLFLAPLETADDNTVVSSMAFVVYDSTMSALWDKVNENGFMTLSYNNERIYSSNKQGNQAINEGNNLSNFLPGDSLTMCYSHNAFKVQWTIPQFTFFTRRCHGAGSHHIFGVGGGGTTTAAAVLHA
ncbi:MAG: hypothetical protein LKE53_11845 [Oscillospiraceae bacterium]|jgi:hypothetical protein|nr:hypothetical protein [Oscillospiraceae bacterium]